MKESGSLLNHFMSAAEGDKVADNTPAGSYQIGEVSITPEMVDRYCLHARVKRNAAILTAIATAARVFLKLSG